MAQVTLTALDLVGAGRISCRRCGGESLANACGIFMWDNPCQALVETTELEVLHRCNREMEWVCPTCHGFVGYERGRGWDKRMTCAVCIEPMEQKAVHRER